MCGRYTLMTDEDYKDLEEIVRDVSRTTGAQVKTEGDIYPTNDAPVLLNREGRRLADLFRWGFPNFYRKGVITMPGLRRRRISRPSARAWRLGGVSFRRPGFMSGTRTNARYAFINPATRCIWRDCTGYTRVSHAM